MLHLEKFEDENSEKDAGKDEALMDVEEVGENPRTKAERDKRDRDRDRDLLLGEFA